MLKITLTILIFSLALVGCVKKFQINDVPVDEQQGNKIEQPAKPVISSENYQQTLKRILNPYWDDKVIKGIKDEIIELTAPAEFLSLHLNVVIAFELIEQGQKDSDQSKIEDGIDRLNDLADQNDWLR